MSDVPAGATLRSPVGQVGTGTTIESLIQSGDAEKKGYQWIHGPSLHPFEPHENLDGVEFESFDDDVLQNTEGFPDNAFYLPGDHWGCTCDFMPLWDVGDGSPAEEAPAEDSGSFLGGDEAMAIFEDAFSALKQDVLDRVHEYGQSGYASINKGLREPGPDLVELAKGDKAAERAMREIQDAVTARVDGIDKAIQEQKPTVRNALVHRGIHEPEAWETNAGAPSWSSLQPGDVFADPAYVSTTTDASIADDFATGTGSFRLDIEVPAGSQALAMDQTGATLANESEVLLPRGSRFQVLSRDKNTIRVRLL